MRVGEAHGQEGGRGADIGQRPLRPPAAIGDGDQRGVGGAEAAGDVGHVVLAQLQLFDAERDAVARRVGQPPAVGGQLALGRQEDVARGAEVQRRLAVQRGAEAAGRQAPRRHGDPGLGQAAAALRGDVQGAAAGLAGLGREQGRGRRRQGQDAAVGRTRCDRARQGQFGPGAAGGQLHPGSVEREGPERPLQLGHLGQVVSGRGAEAGPGGAGGGQGAGRRHAGHAVAHQIQIQSSARVVQAEVARGQLPGGQGQRPLHLERRIASACGQALRRQDGPGQSGSRRRSAVQPDRGGRGDAPFQSALASLDHDVGAAEGEVGAAPLQARTGQVLGPEPGLALADDLEGLDPALGPAVEVQRGFGLAALEPARGQGVGGQAGGDDGAAVAATRLQIGVGQVSGQAQPGGGPAGVRHGEAVGGGLDLQRHAVADGGQVDDGAQAAGLDVAALQRGGGQAGVQPHQLAVVDAGVGQDLNRAVFGVDAGAAAFDDDQGRALVGARRLGHELFDQRVQRAQGQLALLPAGAGQRPDQADAAGGHAQPALGPGQAQGVVDLDPFDLELRIARIADADLADEAVDFELLDLDVGVDALAVQPADQKLAGGGAPVQIKGCGQDDQKQQADQQRDQRCARDRPLGAAGLGSGSLVGQGAWRSVGERRRNNATDRAAKTGVAA
ncbi:hypothetical protein D3C85_765740 [compost metagenome]